MTSYRTDLHSFPAQDGNSTRRTRSFSTQVFAATLAVCALGFSSQAFAKDTRTCPVKLTFYVSGEKKDIYTKGISGTAGSPLRARKESRRKTEDALDERDTSDIHKRAAKEIPSGLKVNVAAQTYNADGLGCEKNHTYTRQVTGTGPAIRR